MAFLSTRSVVLSGISACVPKNIEENLGLSCFKGNEDKNFIANTGIERRRKSDQNTTSLDLCFYAAEQLIKDLKWTKSQIDCLIFVTQTPDYILPSNSCILQERLGLTEECYAVDISNGCSGWIYGMSIISSLLQSGDFKKGLLLVGDTILKVVSSKDKSAWPLFGDAGTASAFEYRKSTSNFHFHLATDGSGYNAIIIPEGGNRNPCNKFSLVENEIEDRICRNNLQIILDGMNVFSFGISKAPESVTKLIDHFQIDKEKIDVFLFHQANLILNEKIRKKLNIKIEKVPYSLANYGNTSSASIPLTLVTNWRNQLISRRQLILACGFGVGLSWGSVYFETDCITCSQLIEI